MFLFIFIVVSLLKLFAISSLLETKKKFTEINTFDFFI